VEVKVNGQTQSLSEGMNLSELIQQKGLNPRRIVVEHNLRIIKSEELPQVGIKENDTIEIVSFLGGGICKIY